MMCEADGKPLAIIIWKKESLYSVKMDLRVILES